MVAVAKPPVGFDSDNDAYDSDTRHSPETAGAPETAGDITSVITRSSVLSTLVKGLRCLKCGAASLVIRVADHRTHGHIVTWSCRRRCV